MKYTVEVRTASGPYVISGSYPTMNEAVAEVGRLQELAGADIARLGVTYTCVPPFVFEVFGEVVDLREQPTGPSPDPSKPYIWLNGQWLLVATDKADDE